jgi:dipeptidyl aminopeptidase/acylaminoacyl peptidase
VVSLAWSPDGQAIAFIGHDQGIAEGVNQRLWLVDVADGATRCLTGGLDRSVGTVVRADDARGDQSPDIAWALDGARVYFLYADAGNSYVGWATRDGPTGVAIGGSGACLSFSLLGNLIAYVQATPSTPGELIVEKLDGSPGRTLTRMNASWMSDLELGEITQFTLCSDEGHALDGWLVRPPRAKAGRHPVILEIHGGPHYPLGNRFYYEFQRLAAQGYLVVYGNPCGSQGYGEAHAARVLGDWGGADFRDVMQLVDAAAADRHADPGRLALCGVSYGGYMVGWIIAHDQRFRAAVAESGIFNCVSASSTGAGLDRFWSSEFGGAPSERSALYIERSPLTHVAAIRTPLLLVHAELDEQSPIGQSEEMFTALRQLGRRTEFVRIPGEGHLINLVGRPSRRIARAAAIDRWLAEHLGTSELEAA